MRSSASGSISRKAFFDPFLPAQRQPVSILAVPGCLLGVASGSTSQAVDLACICFIRVFLYQGFPWQPFVSPGERQRRRALGGSVTRGGARGRNSAGDDGPEPNSVESSRTGIARPQTVHARQATSTGIRYARQGSIT